jgi:uncharacterized protein YjiS (DUF1127 family)
VGLYVPVIANERALEAAMSTMTLDTASFRTVPAIRRRPSLGLKILAGLTVAASAFARELRIRKAAWQLEEMPDHMLSDIGLARGDIDYALRHGRPWRDGEGPA